MSLRRSRLLNPIKIKYSPILLILVLLFSAFLVSDGNAQQNPPRILFVMGSESPVTLTSLFEAIKQNNQASSIEKPRLLILPLAYSTKLNGITEDERAGLLQLAEIERQSIAEDCQRALGLEITCLVELVPVLTRDDAQTTDILTNSIDLVAILISGDHPKIGAQILVNTPLESQLESIYKAGVIISSYGQNINMFSQTMLTGNRVGYSDNRVLEFGSVDAWDSDELSGANFGLKNTVLAGQIYALNQLGALLNVIACPTSPDLGLGIDSNTSFQITNETEITSINGTYPIMVLDAATYNAAQQVSYKPCLAPEQCTNMLSLRNILVHLLSPGVPGYDLANHMLRGSSPSPRLSRNFASINTSSTNGALYLTGRLANQTVAQEIIRKFTNVSGGAKANLLILTTGYVNSEEAQQAAEEVAELTNVPTQIQYLPSTSSTMTKVPPEISGIILLAEDTTLVNLNPLLPIRSAWLAGKPILAMDAAAVILGSTFAEDPQGMLTSDPADPISQTSFIKDTVILRPGLDIINVTLVSRLLTDNHWGQLFSLAYQHPTTVALGLNDNMAIILTADGAEVIGNNGLVSLDLRNAKVDLGTNGGYIIINGLMDVFAPGDKVKPEVADIELVPLQAPTPVRPTNTPRPTATATATNTAIPPTHTPTLTATSTSTATATEAAAISIFKKKATRTPRPTSTPVPIPPPSDPKDARLMILFSVILLVIILITVWLNSKRIKLI